MNRDITQLIFANAVHGARPGNAGGAGRPTRASSAPAGGQPFVAPASSPRTKKRCSAKNTISGTMIEMNAPAVSSSHDWPYDPERSCRAFVIGYPCPEVNTVATSRSFHTQRNWKMPKEAMAGIDSGSTMRKNTCP